MTITTVAPASIMPGGYPSAVPTPPELSPADQAAISRTRDLATELERRRRAADEALAALYVELRAQAALVQRLGPAEYARRVGHPSVGPDTVRKETRDARAQLARGDVDA